MARPMLIAVGGVSGSGKTTLAAALATFIYDSVHLDSDRIRKDIFGVAEGEKLPETAYTWEVTEKLIAENESRAKKALAAGKDVIISALFLDKKSKARQESLAQECNAQLIGIFLKADIEALIERVATRTKNPSDAGLEVLHKQLEEPDNSAGDWYIIDANKNINEVIELAQEVIESMIIKREY